MYIPLSFLLLCKICIICIHIGSICAQNEYSGIADWAQPYNLPNGATHYYGDVRAAVMVDGDYDAVQVKVVWRRKDPNPASINIEVLKPYELGQPKIDNVVMMEASRESAIIVFQPLFGPGLYHIYYLPFDGSGDYLWVNVDYNQYAVRADQEWLTKYVQNGAYKNLPQATFLQLQSRTGFGAFGPMELIALQSEVNAIIKKNPGSNYLLFPEDRLFPLRMRDYLSMRWAQKGPSTSFRGIARINEFYPFQIGVFSILQDTVITGVNFTDLVSANTNGRIPSSALRCFNLGGIDFLGVPFSQNWTVPKGTLNSLWCGIDTGSTVSAGDSLSGSMTLQTQPPIKISLTLNISSQEPVSNNGYDDLWRLSRLNWLDSTKGRTNAPLKPYTNLEIGDSNTIYILEKKISLADNGLPKSVSVKGNPVLEAPMDFRVLIGGKMVQTNVTNPVVFTKISPIIAEWIAKYRTVDGSIQITIVGSCAFDGYLNYSATVTALKTVTLSDVQLYMDVTDYASKFIMGMRNEGGFLTQSLQWNWVLNEGSNNIWLGNMNAGIRLKLKGYGPEWDNPQYRFQYIPLSWGNNGLGGCTVSDNAEVVAFSGARKLTQGNQVAFNFDIMLTPVKPINKEHWNWKYFQVGGDGYDYHTVDEVRNVYGANIINIHQGTAGFINPNINYPFRPIAVETLSNYSNWAHSYNMKVKLYYTVRELSTYAEETFALRTLGHEIYYAGGDTGGPAWTVEHIAEDYSPCWNTLLVNGEFDPALCDTGVGRWTNYYIEGIRQLVEGPVQIDGIYYDGYDFTRDTIQRVRGTLDENRPDDEKLIDVHCGNLYQPGWWASTANSFSATFPYVDSLWFGEGYDYSLSYDWWFVAVSGLPFGLTGSMLGCGNPWYGMLFAMTNRALADCNPKPIWDFWDYWGINQSEMVGWWEPVPLVTTNVDHVMVTVYQKDSSALLAIGNWNNQNVAIRLTINWESLGLNETDCVLWAKEIQGFQPEQTFKPADSIMVPANQGWLLILKERS